MINIIKSKKGIDKFSIYFLILLCIGISITIIFAVYAGINEKIEQNNYFHRGIEITDSFEKGKNLEQLIDEGVIAKSFSKINMNMTRPLYKHQEKAIRKVVCDKRNLVVSTGTGSGKTTFLNALSNYIPKDERVITIDKK